MVTRRNWFDGTRRGGESGIQGALLSSGSVVEVRAGLQALETFKGRA